MRTFVYTTFDHKTFGHIMKSATFGHTFTLVFSILVLYQIFNGRLCLYLINCVLFKLLALYDVC